MQKIGKIIVSISRDENEDLEKLYREGLENGVEGLRMIGMDEIKKMEPYICLCRHIFPFYIHCRYT